ncbi:hypothetical protein [Blastomonas sp.]|uniref:hypothetical protein n=1 Tax=Blastomonas sp. TaxID=1909299 RepID=UPI0035930BD9
MKMMQKKGDLAAMSKIAFKEKNPWQNARSPSGRSACINAEHENRLDGFDTMKNRGKS